MIVYENIYQFQKVWGSKNNLYRVVALEVNMVNFEKKMTSFKNVLFYVYFDIYLSKKA